MADEPNNTTPSLDPQAAVDAALTSPIEPVAIPTPEVKKDEIVPEEMLAAAPPVAAPVPEPVPSTPVGKMADDTPLAFAGTSSLPPLEPIAPTNDVPPLPTTAQAEPKLPEPAYVPPAGNGSEPVTVTEKPKKRGKGLKALVIGIFFLLATAVAGMYGYYRITGQAGLLAIVIGEICTPGTTEKKGCTVDGCNGYQTRQCNSTGSGWGAWSSSCTKNVASCGSSTSGCTNGATKACTISNCPGTVTCAGGTYNNQPCVKKDPSCGAAPTNVQASCTQCGGAGGLVCQTVKSEPNCDTKLNTCSSNTDCGGSAPGPQCSATKPCENGAVCGTDGKCVDPGGPVGCGYSEDSFCTAAGGQPVTEPGGKTWCDDKGHWCGQTRYECMFGVSPNRTWCFMRLGTNCSTNVSDKCVSKPSPTPSPSIKPSPSPIPSPSPSPKPVLACVSITKDKADKDITKGSLVSFTCAGSVTPTGAVNLTYQFRIRKDSGTWTTLSATGNKSTYTVQDYGNYEVQCHACGQIDNASKCSPEWTGVTQ